MRNQRFVIGYNPRILQRIIPSRSYDHRFNDREDRRSLVGARLIALCTVIIGIVYIVWVAITLNPAHLIVSGAFVFAESLCLMLFIVAMMSVWTLRYKPLAGLPAERAHPVDVFITVCGEPLSILRATFRGVASIRWPERLSVYVLDDGASDEVRSLVAQYGWTYLSRTLDLRPPAAGKAGNLNFGLARSTGELILVLDADQVPHPNILEVLAGYLRFPRVAFIQSKQSFWVPEGDPFFNEDRVFYGAVQLGYDNHDAAISCGSGVIYRRAALNEMGGFAEWNLVEDLTSSYELHSRGWKSFYYPHDLSQGLAPSDVWGVYRQRGQWCLDTMRLFFWDNPLLKRGLTFAQRMSYLVIPLAYLCAAFVFPFLFAVPIWSYLSGASVLLGPEWQFVLIRGLYFISMALALRLLFRRHEAGRQFQTLVGLFPVYLAGTLRALVYPPRRRPRYRPNNQFNTPAGRLRTFVAVLPQLALLMASAMLPFYALFAGTASPRLIFANIFVSAVAIWSLLPLVIAALARKVWKEQDNPYLRAADASQAPS